MQNKYMEVEEAMSDFVLIQNQGLKPNNKQSAQVCKAPMHTG